MEERITRRPRNDPGELQPKKHLDPVPEILQVESRSAGGCFATGFLAVDPCADEVLSLHSRLGESVTHA